MTVVTSSGALIGNLDPLEAHLRVWDAAAGVPTGVLSWLPLVWSPQRSGVDLVARSAGLLVDMPIEDGPHGWKYAGRAGIDARRVARSWSDDLSACSVVATGHRGPLVVSVLGPWSLAARLYLSRGDRVLSDTGACIELGESLAVGLVELVQKIQRGVPGAQVVFRLVEPQIVQVLSGQVPSFSGYQRLAVVPGPDIVAQLQGVVNSVAAAGASLVLGVPASAVGVAVHAGASAVEVRVEDWSEPRWSLIARAVERGLTFWASFPDRWTGAQSAEHLVTGWRRIGLPAAGLAKLHLVDSDPSLDVDHMMARWRELGRAGEIIAEHAYA